MCIYKALTYQLLAILTGEMLKVFLDKFQHLDTSVAVFTTASRGGRIVETVELLTIFFEECMRGNL